MRDDLQQMVLHDVANGTDLLVELSAPMHAEILAIVICTSAT
jgi:hypothetical protein